MCLLSRDASVDVPGFYKHLRVGGGSICGMAGSAALLNPWVLLAVTASSGSLVRAFPMKKD